MDVKGLRALRGPNIWSRNTVLEAQVCGAMPSDSPSACGYHAFLQRLHALLPGLEMPDSPYADEAASMVHALAYTVLNLQKLVGSPVSFVRTEQGTEPETYLLAVEYVEESVGRRAVEIAESLCLAAIRGQAVDASADVQQLRDLYEDIKLGPSTGSIVAAAKRRGVPIRRLTEGSLVQLGWGDKQRRIQAAETDATSAIAESIAQDKELTKMLLRAAGVPVPDGRCAKDAEDAVAAAREIDGPVVIKPRDGNQGRGVAVNLTSDDAIRRAYALAEEIDTPVMVEQYVPGYDYRLLVVGDKLVAAARRDPPHVVGDGVHTISELIDQINTDPLRGEGHGSSLTKIELDDIALATLARQGCAPDSIPEKGRNVVLRNNANLSTGGTATDVTDDVHPDIAAMAVSAARMVGLDICGIDFISPNVFEPLSEQSGCVVEVNAAPGLRMHLDPSFGKPRNVGEALVSTMFAPGENGRIPVVAVTGTNGKTTTVRLLAHVLGLTGRVVGMTNSDGVYIGSRCIDRGDCSGPRSARKVLAHPRVQAAVLEAARGGILREGLGFDRCDVAVVTNIGQGDHLGLNGIHTAKELARVKQVLVENVAEGGAAVLNAADPLTAAMAAHCPGETVFFAVDGSCSLLAAQRAQGRRVVFGEDGSLVAVQGDIQWRMPLADVPFTYRGAVAFQVENALAAIAAAWALGIDWSIIQAGLSTFHTDAKTVPGRFNVFNYRGATVVADYGHNRDAVSALIQALRTWPADRRCVMLSAAGDRRDEDLRELGRLVGSAFDEVVLYEDSCQRGREDGEIIQLLRQGLASSGRLCKVRAERGEFKAIDAALAGLNEGDLCLLLIDQVEAALRHIELRVKEREPVLSCS